ncbi:hypothetical protein E6W39_01215 [Kitasatospora acidiphila]|uniref:Uncharacterized protein n=1 Tax=Kitasatospora acidiphila TaxID=2567942 RepID=A0A540WG63_9ACTN|nr:hypothetical protein [Kitasatospora acidiphila]TQF07972.1 hypothetical protein E6W39_01215 [Kitasatospora acidiphila]
MMTITPKSANPLAGHTVPATLARPPLCLTDEPLDRPGTQALDQLVERACESYGIARHYHPGGDPAALEEAMRHTLASAAGSLVAAALHRLADDPRPDLTIDQRLYLDGLVVDLDLETAEYLSGAFGDQPPVPAPGA